MIILLCLGDKNKGMDSANLGDYHTTEICLERQRKQYDMDEGCQLKLTINTQLSQQEANMKSFFIFSFF